MLDQDKEVAESREGEITQGVWDRKKDRAGGSLALLLSASGREDARLLREEFPMTRNSGPGKSTTSQEAAQWKGKTSLRRERLE